MMKCKLPVSCLQVFLGALIFLGGCNKKSDDSPAIFETMPLSKKINPGIIDEASGIADSKANPGYLWVEQDSGNPNDIALLSDSGAILKKINIRSAINRDWEDIALANGPLPGTNYLYIANTGDNNSAYTQYAIYRFPEPSATVDTVSVYDELRFQYPDGPHDAEAILVDNVSKDIYVITKQDPVSRIYKFLYPQSSSGVTTIIYAGALSFNGVVSAASSATGELVVKTYSSVYYWKRNSNETIEQAMSRNPVALPYQQEPQGEAICFKNDLSGFYTLSERPAPIPSVSLDFYRRK